jgi:hypothetical protein
MLSSIAPSAIICVLYVVLVIISPSFMKNRQAMDLKNLLLVYNFAMVALSGYLFYEVCIFSYDRVLVFEEKF